MPGQSLASLLDCLLEADHWGGKSVCAGSDNKTNYRETDCIREAPGQDSTV